MKSNKENVKSALRLELGLKRFRIWAAAGKPFTHKDILAVKGLGPKSVEPIRKWYKNQAEEAIRNWNQGETSVFFMFNGRAYSLFREDCIYEKGKTIESGRSWLMLGSHLKDREIQNPQAIIDEVTAWLSPEPVEPVEPNGYLMVDGESVKCEYKFERGHGRLIEALTGDVVHSFESEAEYFSVNSDWTTDLHHPGGILLTLEDCKRLGIQEATWENV